MGYGNALSTDPVGDDERSTEAIRRDIERRRESIAKTVDQAGQKIQQSLSWREHVRERPYGAVAVAAIAGLALARLLRSRGTANEQLAAGLTRNLEEIGRSLRDGLTPPRHGLARALGAALTAIATQSAVAVFRERVVQAAAPKAEVPGVAEERRRG